MHHTKLKADIGLAKVIAENCPKVIRFEKPSNNQNKKVTWANSYLVIESESSETIRRTPETMKT